MTTVTVHEAAEVVLGTKPTSAAQLDAARTVMFEAARSGYTFRTGPNGSAARPEIIVTAPAYQCDDQADEDERRYAQA